MELVVVHTAVAERGVGRGECKRRAPAPDGGGGAWPWWRYAGVGVGAEEDVEVLRPAVAGRAGEGVMVGEFRFGAGVDVPEAVPILGRGAFSEARLGAAKDGELAVFRRLAGKRGR